MTSDVAQLRAKMADVVDRHGEWTAHGIRIAEGLSTIEPLPIDRRLGRIAQVIADLARTPLAESRVLDLACAEGHYAIECALHGAEVVAIEGREDNLAKVQFVKDALGLDRLSLHQDDVRNLSRQTYGSFDLVICSGILYHLDAPDIFEFAQRVAEVSQGLTIVDTQISIRDRVAFDHQGRTYWGCYYPEQTDLWASIGNPRSVWLTRPSLYNLLRDVGFTSVLECHVPSMIELPRDRITLVAVKGRPAQIRSTPVLDSFEAERWPEQAARRVDACQDPKAQAIRRIKSVLPPFVRTPFRNLRTWMRKRKAAPPAGPWEWTEPWRRR
jgi:SAM-dependent methyltransferase